MMQVEEYIKGTSLDFKLLELIRLRVSQINGCAYCVDMHFKEAEAAGENIQRLYSVSCWRETPYYTARERAALAWAEAVTMVADSGIPDELYDEVREHFSKEEIANLSLAVSTINGWNRLVMSFRFEPGTHSVAR